MCARLGAPELWWGDSRLPTADTVKYLKSAVLAGPILPRRAYLRLILFCMCPPLCAGVLGLMPAWVCRDVRSVFLLFFL